MFCSADQLEEAEEARTRLERELEEARDLAKQTLSDQRKHDREERKEVRAGQMLNPALIQRALQLSVLNTKSSALDMS